MSTQTPPNFRHTTTALRRGRWVIPAICVLIVLVGLACWFFLQPATDKKIVMSVGNDGGTYQTFAKQYAASLAQQGIKLDMRRSSGAVENYQRLKDASSEYELAFVQSGIGDTKEAPHLQAIAAVTYEPLWLFYRSELTLNRISQLGGRRIAVGVPGSGLRRITLGLLAASGVTSVNATLPELSGQRASEELLAGRIDAAMLIGAIDSPLIDKLLHSDLKLMNISQAGALVKKFPSLSIVTLPRGAISLEKDLPAQDVTLLSATAMLVAKNSLSPNLIYALVDSVADANSTANYFAAHGEFPNQRIDDFPISDDAARYIKSGRPFLQNYLPFWLANFIEQRFVILIPMIAALFAVLQAVPRLRGYRLRTRLSRWYDEIKLLEDEMPDTAVLTPGQVRHWQDELEQIDDHVHRLKLPQQYYNQMYGLKLSINLLRDRLREYARDMSDA